MLAAGITKLNAIAAGRLLHRAIPTTSILFEHRVLVGQVANLEVDDDTATDVFGRFVEFNLVVREISFP